METIGEWARVLADDAADGKTGAAVFFEAREAEEFAEFIRDTTHLTVDGPSQGFDDEAGRYYWRVYVGPEK